MKSIAKSWSGQRLGTKPGPPVRQSVVSPQCVGSQSWWIIPLSRPPLILAWSIQLLSGARVVLLNSLTGGGWQTVRGRDVIECGIRSSSSLHIPPIVTQLAQLSQICNLIIPDLCHYTPHHSSRHNIQKISAQVTKCREVWSGERGVWASWLSVRG